MEAVRPPRQRRSQETLSRFVEAARSLLEEKHYDEITVSEIAERAGSSIGAFYARFEDKEALLRHLRGVYNEETAAEVGRVAAARDWEAAPLPAVVVELVKVMVQQHRKHRGALRALVSRSMAGRADARSPAGLETTLPSPLVDLIIKRRSEISHPNPDVAVHLGLGMVASVIRERVLFPELSMSSKPLAPVTDAVLVEELSQALLGFLGVNSTRGSG